MSRKKVFRIVIILMTLVLLLTACDENEPNEVEGEEPGDKVQETESREEITDMLPIQAYFPFSLGNGVSVCRGREMSMLLLLER